MADKPSNFVLLADEVDYPLIPGHEYKIGRDVTNHVHLESDNVSRFHAILRVSAEGCILEDLSSTNGTYVNGIRVGKTGVLTLAIGDRIRFGDQDFIFDSES